MQPPPPPPNGPTPPTPGGPWGPPTGAPGQVPQTYPQGQYPQGQYGGAPPPSGPPVAPPSAPAGGPGRKNPPWWVFVLIPVVGVALIAAGATYLNTRSGRAPGDDGSAGFGRIAWGADPDGADMMAGPLELRRWVGDEQDLSASARLVPVSWGADSVVGVREGSKTRAYAQFDAGPGHDQAWADRVVDEATSAWLATRGDRQEFLDRPYTDSGVGRTCTGRAITVDGPTPIGDDDHFAVVVVRAADGSALVALFETGNSGGSKYNHSFDAAGYMYGVGNRYC